MPGRKWGLYRRYYLSGAAARTGKLKGKERKKCIENRFRTFIGKNKQTTHKGKKEIRNADRACMSRCKIEAFINSINNKSITNKKRRSLFPLLPTISI